MLRRGSPTREVLRRSDLYHMTGGFGSDGTDK
jgi:hypothetical protein